MYRVSLVGDSPSQRVQTACTQSGCDLLASLSQLATEFWT